MSSVKSPSMSPSKNRMNSTLVFADAVVLRHRERDVELALRRVTREGLCDPPPSTGTGDRERERVRAVRLADRRCAEAAARRLAVVDVARVRADPVPLVAAEMLHAGRGLDRDVPTGRHTRLVERGAGPAREAALDRGQPCATSASPPVGGLRRPSWRPAISPRRRQPPARFEPSCPTSSLGPDIPVPNGRVDVAGDGSDPAVRPHRAASFESITSIFHRRSSPDGWGRQIALPGPVRGTQPR